MNRLIIVGSPRVDGRSANLAELLFEYCIEEHPDEEVALAPVSTLDVAPCQGCNWCKLAAAGEVAALDGEESEDAAAADGEEQPQGVACVMRDDMAELYGLIDAADELTIVSPVYFASAPAQLKALLDRLQPYYWTDARKNPKRPATLHVVGEGGDPHGFDPLIGQVRSALSVAGFELVRVLDWVGKIDEQGEITDEAVEYVAASGSLLGGAAFARAGEAAGKEEAPARAGQDEGSSRPRLSLPDSRQKAASQVYARPEEEVRNTGKDGGKQRKGSKGKPQGKPAAGGKGSLGKGSGKRGSGRPNQQRNSGRNGGSAGSGRGSRAGR